VGGKCDFFDAEPLEHTGFSTDSWNKRWDESPVCEGLLYSSITSSFSRSAYYLKSLYLEMTQIRILKSSSPQFRLIRLVFSILHYKVLTFLS
jgi:hypothetical protein